MTQHGYPERHYGPRPFLSEMRDAMEKQPYERIQVVPLAPTIGAEIRGVDLRETLDDATFAEVERAHHDYKVLVFRDQDVTTQQHLDFARRFGALEEHPFLPAADGNDEVVRFQKDEDVVGVENVWHSDVSWRECPALGAVLRAREVPRVGGDTLFSDMIAAYEGLDDEIKQTLEGKIAVHDFTHSFGLAMPPEQLEEQQKRFPAVEHPIVRTHPATGRKILYVNGIFTSHIKDMERSESDALLQHLYRQAAVPEYQFRLHWEKNTVAFWDNRSVQHYAANDYWPQARIMERVAIVGDRPH